MYSILCLGMIMLTDAFGYDVPVWLSPIVTFGIVGYFLYKSMQVANALSAGEQPAEPPGTG